MFNEKKVEKAIKQLLIAFGEDPEREGLKETPRRVTGYWKELLEGSQYTNAEIAEKYGKKFEVDNNPLVVKQVTDIYSHCEHHLALMYDVDVVIAYLPAKNAKGKYEVIGLSKIPRIVDLCAKRLQLQEKLANDIAETISLATGSKDVYVNVKANHSCVSARGVKKDGFTDVTVILGQFQTDKALRDEVERKVD